MVQNLEMIVKAVIIGHAIGDALGVPVEFCEREELATGPVDDMEAFGTYPVPAGSWSDDTSMSIAALDSLKNGNLDYDDIMNNFVKWCSLDEYTPTGEMFDIGRTCLSAIRNFLETDGKPALECGLSDERSNGNGSLMRIHPFSLYTFISNCEDKENEIIHNASSLTHAHKRSQIACGIYTLVLHEILNCPQKTSIKLGLDKAYDMYKDEPENKYYTRIYDPDFVNTHIDNIKSTGYVVDTLEAALWCLMSTDSYSECVLKAVNLGDDTDTVAAIAGGLAGALYGYDAIPFEWLNTLLRRDYLEEMCETAVRNWTTHNIY